MSSTARSTPEPATARRSKAIVRILECFIRPPKISSCREIQRTDAFGLTRLLSVEIRPTGRAEVVRHPPGETRTNASKSWANATAVALDQQSGFFKEKRTTACAAVLVNTNRRTIPESAAFLSPPGG